MTKIDLMPGVPFMLRVCVAALILLGDTLWAQEEAAGETQAQKLYETAFTALVKGQYGPAYNYLTDITNQYPGTLYATSAAERKKRLEELGLYRVGRRPIDQGGRIGALIFGTLYSTWLGVGTAIVAGADSDQALAAGMMIGAPAGLLTTHLLTRDTALSPGQTTLIKLGGLWGTWQGYGWMVAADERSGRRLTAAAMAGGLAGIAGSGALTRYTDISRGDASLLNHAGGWGTWFGFCASVMAEADGDWNLRNALLGGNLGLVAMAMLIPRVELSPEHARLINLRGLAATFVATGFVGLLALEGIFDNATVPMGLIMAGGVAGLWDGVRTRERDLPSGASGQRSVRVVAEWGWPAPALGVFAPAAAGRLKGGRPAHPSVAIRATLVKIRF